MKTWSPPQGLIIQPGSILVPGRVGYVPEPYDMEWGWGRQRFEVDDSGARIALSKRNLVPGTSDEWTSGESGPLLTPVSIPRWDLSSLTEAELDSLQVAIEAQRLAGIGNPCPATVADRSALR